MLTTVFDLKKGDRFGDSWMALTDAECYLGAVVVTVRYRDGGQGERQWDDPDTEIEITRGEVKQ